MLGWPDFYSRFGFKSARQFGLDSEFGGAADGTFQILWLNDHPKTHTEVWCGIAPSFLRWGTNEYGTLELAILSPGGAPVYRRENAAGISQAKRYAEEPNDFRIHFRQGHS